MQTELTPLVNALSEVAYDAGRALLVPVDATVTRRYVARYNGLYHQLCEVAPCLRKAGAPLPEDATAGSIRIAARTAATYVQATTTCFSRTAV